MKRFIPLACAGLLAAAVATPSFAADIVRPSLKAPVFVAPFSWSGFYVGINGGGAWGNTKLSNVLGTQSFKDSGGLIGGTVGYNLQTGNWVWGFEADIDASWLKGTSSAAPLCVLGCELKQTWLATARGRVGYAFDRWLPYFTGGLAIGDSKITVTNNNAGLLGVLGLVGLGGSQTDTRTGWTLGGGLEWAFMSNWSAKVEFLHVDLGTKTCAVATCFVATDVALTEDLLRVGLNYRF